MRGGLTRMAMAIRTDERGEISVAELAELNRRFELEPAAGIISWAVDTFHPRLCLTASMTDAVLIDLAVRVEPSIEVVFIDTGYHFPETLETVELVRRRYGLNLRMMTVPPHDEELWRVDPENCCSAIKVGQLDRALADKEAWMSGLRRAEAATRADAPIVSLDLRGLAADIGQALENAGLSEVGGVRVNISGCTNSCGQHHVADIGFVGVERRAHGKSAPGYQMLLGGRIGQMEVEFGAKALRLPAKATAEATVRVVGRFANERAAGEEFGQWLERVGGAGTLGMELKDLDEFPDPGERPDFYVDFDETGPYEAVVGAGECAGA